MAAGAGLADSVSLFAPPEAGTYYYGGCVAQVAGEQEVGNNCSAGVRVIVYKLPYEIVAAQTNEIVAAQTSTTTTRREQTFSLTGGASATMVWIPAGTFQMGGTLTNEQPVHEVNISRGFWLGKYEVTQGQWEEVMSTTPWSGRAEVQENSSHPAVYISWDDVQSFITSLNTAAGSDVYRLPTEAEWEYACRAGTTTPWSFGATDSQIGNYAWYDNNKVGAYGHAVGQKRANPWGLHDMHGNVWEWVQDRYSDTYYASSPRVDPPGPSSGSQRVRRGGAYDNVAQFVRSAYRGNNQLTPTSRLPNVGFRLVRIR